jgi:serine/threonine protein kinase
MTEARLCPRCGAGLRADAPEGLCPKCLLEQAIQPPSISPMDPESEGTAAFAHEFVPPAPAELAKHFPQLEILEFVGQGGMGIVYKVRQSRLDRLAALKILPPQANRDPAFAERFAREARALAKLAHPGIVAVYDFGQSDGLYFFLMEFVDGVNLRHLMRQGKLKPENALQIVPQICEALQFAHEQGVVHRDIKPENILVDKKGRVRIADFGLAKLLGQKPADSALTGSRQVMGTPHYMAPEQMEKPLQVDHRADIYSLGVVFYEMLTGELPLGRFPPPSQRVTVDVRLDQVVLRALEKEPERRYQQASEVKTDVESISPRTPRAGLERHTLTRVDEPLGLPVPLILKRVWNELRSFCARHALTVIKVALLLIFGSCLVLFLSYSESRSFKADGRTLVHSFQIGFPSPWFTAEKEQAEDPIQFSTGFYIIFSSWSWIIAALGAAACCLYGMVRKVETAKQTKLDVLQSRGFLLWGWIIVAALGVAAIRAVMMMLFG